MYLSYSRSDLIKRMISRYYMRRRRPFSRPWQPFFVDLPRCSAALRSLPVG